MPYVIIASNDKNEIQAFGTPTEGRSFKSERIAKWIMARMETEYPHARFLLLDINPTEGLYNDQ